VAEIEGWMEKQMKEIGELKGRTQGLGGEEDFGWIRA